MRKLRKTKELKELNYLTKVVGKSFLGILKDCKTKEADKVLKAIDALPDAEWGLCVSAVALDVIDSLKKLSKKAKPRKGK